MLIRIRVGSSTVNCLEVNNAEQLIFVDMGYTRTFNGYFILLIFIDEDNI
jgi:hypothetical protein